MIPLCLFAKKKEVNSAVKYERDQKIGSSNTDILTMSVCSHGFKLQGFMCTTEDFTPEIHFKINTASVLELLYSNSHAKKAI